MSPVPRASTDESEGRSTWVNPTRVVGILEDINIIKNKNPLTGGRRAGTYRSSYSIRVSPLEEVKMEDGSDYPAMEKGIDVRYDYAEWDDLRDRELKPEKGSHWYKLIVPWWKDKGIDLSNADQVEGLLMKRVVFEVQTFELNYERQSKDDRGELMWETTPEDDPDGKGDPVMETATFTTLLPVELEGGAEVSEDQANAKALELWNENDGKKGPFKRAALDDPLIKQVTKVRKRIQSGKWSPDKD